MGIEGTVNDQITDSLSQTMTHIVGNSSAETKSMLDTLMAETVGMAMYNAVTNQHNAQMVSNASVIAACARMLKVPIATTPATPLFAPVIAAITPASIPVNEAQVIQITGTGFSASNLVVRILDADNALVATLAGTAQISGPVTSTSITFTYTFTAEGTYSLQVQNSDAIKSNKSPITVAVTAAVLTTVIPTSPRTFSVRGKHFHPGLSFTLENAEGKPVEGASVGAIHLDNLTLTVPCNIGPGPFRLCITNPGQAAASKLFHAAIPMVPVATVYDACEEQHPIKTASTAAEDTPCKPPSDQQQ
jgi:hypothetical protein